ncbi:unnamed protein product [marine sediment metagenome]|uniref:Uncharacterized protein n=1 Tax=marine sediment metagenome TaxID=412755 RepID=X1GIQ6_9ZZZZ
MSTEEQTAFNQALDHETKKLMTLTPETREQHVISIVDWLIVEIHMVKKQKNPALQREALIKLFDKLNKGAPKIIPPIMYMFKPEFQLQFIRILQSMSNEKN